MIILAGSKVVKIALFTSKRKSLVKISSHLCVSIILLLFFGALSYLINKRNQTNLIGNVQAMFRSDRDIGNTAYLSRRLADIETLGLVKCVIVKSDDLGVIYTTNFKESCGIKNVFWDFFINPTVNDIITSVDGSRYEITFRSDSNILYKFYIGAFFILSFIAANVILAVYWIKMDLKASEIEREQVLNRILDEKVNQQAEELTAARLNIAIQKSKADMGRQVAHDIKSPLTVINIISNKIKVKLPEEGYLLTQASGQLLNIAEGLLDINRPLTMPSSINVQPELPSTLKESQDVISLDELKLSIEEVFNLKKIEFENSIGLRMSFYCEIESSGYVFAEKVLLKRIISNFLNNSNESILNNGFITLSISLLNNELLIEVRDSGKGMSEDFLKKVCMESITQGKLKGSGLGLFPSIKAIESWGAAFQIFSKINNGTRIEIRFKVFDDKIQLSSVN